MRDQILFQEKNQFGIIILNRPDALNALNDDMFLSLRKQLIAWKNDSQIQAVIIRSRCEKAFCAGGDIRAIYESKHLPLHAAEKYFHLEYEINKFIFHFGKPYIALTHGITMGGGVGVAIHGSHRVAAANMRWAMPETLIGFFPDVGVSYYLSRLPHHFGIYLGLTGVTVDAVLAKQWQLVDYVVSDDTFDQIEQTLCALHSPTKEAIDGVLDNFAKKIPTHHPVFDQDVITVIERCFAFSTIESIISALEKEKSDFALQTAQLLLQRSPTSLKVTLKQLHLAKKVTFDSVIKMDTLIAQTMLRNHDFFEGIRAAIIDKDKTPHWKPSVIRGVSDESVNAYFE